MRNDSDIGGWGSFVLIKVVQPLVQIAVLVFVLYLIVDSVIKGFVSGIGIRVISAALTPLIVFAYIMHFRTDIIIAIFHISGRSIFVVSLVFGILIIVGARFFAQSGGLLVVTLLVYSTVLSLLLQISTEDIREKVFHAYYGISLGFLTTVMFMGMSR